MARAITDQSPLPGAQAAERARSGVRRPDVGVAIVAVVVVAAALVRPLLQDLLDRPAVANWATVFVAITLQAMPFLVLGVTISAVVAAFVPAGLLPRLLPRRPAFAVPAAASAGVVLPGCECGSVPIAQRLVGRGGESLDGATVELTGFVAADDADDDCFRLARYQIACCAADAAPVVVRVVGIHGTEPSGDQWVTVTGSFHTKDTEVPELAATSVVEIAPPDDPYE